jgi:hypothetical protein
LRRIERFSAKCVAVSFATLTEELLCRRRSLRVLCSKDKKHMPPKAFLDTVPSETAYYINSDCLAARPELASVIARCMATWSQIEVELSLTLAAILDTRTDAGVAVYLSIKAANTQRDALRNAALTTLGGDELRAFNAVMSLHNALTPERNNLAHGIFGVMPDHPQSLIWLSSAKHAAWLTRANQRAWNLEFDPDPHSPLRKELFIYTLDDLLEIKNRFVELFNTTTQLQLLLAPVPNLQKEPILKGLLAMTHLKPYLT